MKISIYGTGCAKCKRLEHNTREAISGFGQPFEIEKVEDFSTILDAGVLRTPALAVNGHLVLQGRVPTASELLTVLATTLAEEN